MTLDRDVVVAALPAYDIEEEIGRGAHGIVLAGTHRQLGRRVAVKQLPRALGSDPEVRRRFLSEGRALAAMDHPNIVPVFDFVERDGVLLLVMEYLGGGTLLDRSRAGGLDPELATSAVLAAAAGLEYAHRRGILHRDVKPENLMFNADDQLKVTDFGIAKITDGTTSIVTRDGFTLGTPAYISPEQAQGHELTPASDVYALATVYYEVLAGKLPYPVHADPVVALYQHVHEDPVPIADVVPDLPDPVAAVVVRALARSTADRFPSAAAFARELEQAARLGWGSAPSGGAGPSRVTEPALPATGEARPPPQLPPSGGPARSRRWLLVVAAALVLAGVLGWIFRPGGEIGTPGAGATPSTTATQFALSARTVSPSGSLTLTSQKSCPAFPAGNRGPLVVYVTLVDERQPSPAESEIFGRQFPGEDDLSWSAEVEIPAIATAGPVRVKVSCMSIDPGFEFPGPYYDYPSQDVEVAR